MRRATAVPFWAVFVSGALVLPWTVLGDLSGWQALSPVLTLPVSAVLFMVRAVPTHRFLSAARSGPQRVYVGSFAELRGERRAPTVAAAVGVLLAPLLLMAPVSAFARQLVPTTPVTATVSQCVLKGGRNSPAVECDGSWVVAGHVYRGELPERTARPGDQLPILVRSDDPTKVFGAQNFQNTATGVVFGLVGLAMGLAGAWTLRQRCRWLAGVFRARLAADAAPPV
ncbi:MULTISPECIES: hypothetical protein [Streptacidiphilus]|uniref:DUF3592 domain-containing protein n=2 Tax=Streptacidiphilus TaxID=228398 RepID=A0ABV6UJM4_9ACTN|nr:hypothetical protein [Streptacidiphilus jeojiense]